MARPEGLEPPAYWFEVRLLPVRQSPPCSAVFKLQALSILNRPLCPPVSVALAVNLAVKPIRELSLKYQEKSGG